MMISSQKMLFSFLCFATMIVGIPTTYADAPPIDPPAGIGLFIHNTDTDMTTVDSDGKTQITKQYPLDASTNWYLYPDVLTLKCPSNVPTLDYGTYNSNKDQLWTDLNTDYNNKWQPKMDTNHHIYMMPQLTIDPSCTALDVAHQPLAAITIANAINAAPIDGIEIHLDKSVITQNTINIINILSTQLDADKRIAIDSKTADMDKDPSNLTSLSYWPALNRSSGCKNDQGNCIKGFAIPTIYNDVDTKQSPNGSVGDFYQQMSYLVSKGFNTIASWLGGTSSSTAAGDNYFIQPALPGASSINNAASYLSSDKPQPAVNHNQQWGTGYPADTSSQYGWTQTGVSTASSGHYSLINQFYQPKNGDNRQQVYACHYLCSGLGTYAVIEQILAQTSADKTDYTNLDLWKNISSNLTNFCNIDTAFAQNTRDDHGKKQGLPLQKDWMSAIAKHGLQTHLVGAALYQLNYSPLMDGSPTDTAVDQCANKGCTKLNPYPNTISPTSWTMLTNWLTQKDSGGHGWLSNQALSEDDSKIFASLATKALSCPAPTPGTETIDWPTAHNAFSIPYGVNQQGTIQGITFHKGATLNNSKIGDVLQYNCGIYTGAPAHEHVDNTTCKITTTDNISKISISGPKLGTSQAYALYTSVTVVRNGQLLPNTQVGWIKNWIEIPQATPSESIYWPNADTYASIPSTYTGTSLTGSLYETAMLLKPQDNDAIAYSCGVYDANMKRIKDAICDIVDTSNSLHTVNITKFPTTPQQIKIFFSVSVTRNGSTVPKKIIPWISFTKKATRAT